MFEWQPCVWNGALTVGLFELTDALQSRMLFIEYKLTYYGIHLKWTAKWNYSMARTAANSSPRRCMIWTATKSFTIQSVRCRILSVFKTILEIIRIKFSVHIDEFGENCPLRKTWVAVTSFTLTHYLMWITLSNIKSFRISICQHFFVSWTITAALRATT